MRHIRAPATGGSYGNALTAFLPDAAVRGQSGGVVVARSWGCIRSRSLGVSQYSMVHTLCRVIRTAPDPQQFFGEFDDKLPNMTHNFIHLFLKISMKDFPVSMCLEAKSIAEVSKISENSTTFHDTSWEKVS